VHLVGFITRIYHDARSPERQIPLLLLRFWNFMQITRRSEVQSLLLMLVLMLGHGTRCKRRGAVFIPPDSTGLVGTPPADRPLLPLKFWANPRKSPLKPRSKDLEESALLRLMGQDFDPRWMRSGDHSHPHKQVPVRRLAGFEVVGCCF